MDSSKVQKGDGKHLGCDMPCKESHPTQDKIKHQSEQSPIAPDMHQTAKNTGQKERKHNSWKCH
jgi:hypothetical protein